MPLAIPLNTNDAALLLARKDELVEAISLAAAEMGIPIGYSFDMMIAAKAAGVATVSFLEMLVELEAIKYTLCARRLREEFGE